MKRVTLKDIAQACGVTPTLVSAVLNNRLGKITCVPQKKALILKTARELGYQPNVFARSMVKKNVPVAALMFHHNDENPFYSGNGYFARRASMLTFALEEHKIDSLLVFFRSEEEQIRKLGSLWNKGMIGGVISNIFPASHLAFTAEVKKLQIPYVIMGNPRSEAVCISARDEYHFIRQCHEHYGTKRAFLLQENSGTPVLYPWYDLPGYYRFDYEPLPVSKEIAANPENLIVFLGAEYFLRSKVKFAHPFILEQEQLAYLVPEDIPHILYGRSSNTGAAMAAQLLADWMYHGKKPEECRHLLPQGEVIKMKF